MSLHHSNRYALPSPNGDDPVRNGDNVMRDLVDLLDEVMASSAAGPLSSRPAAGISGRFYFSTNTGDLGFDIGSQWVTVGRADKPQIPVVAELPDDPQDGRIVAFAADPIRGEMWVLRYRADSASDHKWEFIGGAPLHAETDPGETTSSVTYTDMSSVGPTITVPLSGDYFVEAGATAPALTGTAVMSFAVGDDTPLDADSLVVTGSNARRRRKTSLVAGNDIQAKYKSASGGDATFAARYLTLTPVRVG